MPSGTFEVHDDGEVVPSTLSGLADDTLIGRIKWTTLARVLVVSAVLAFAVAVDLGLTPQRAAQAPETVLYQLAATAYAVSFALLLITQLQRNQPSRLVKVAWASVVADVVLALVLVHITDGLQSLFQFGLPLAVLNAAVLLSRVGAMSAATLVSVGSGVLAMSEHGWLHLPQVRVAYLTSLSPRQALSGFEIATSLALQVTAAYATAVLSSHLVRELDRARTRAVLQRREIARLRVRYEDVVSSLPDGLLTLGPDQQITTANPAALEILQLSADVLVGSPLATILPELSAPLHDAPGEWEIARQAPDDMHQTQQVRRRSGDGEMQILACRIAMLRDHTGQNSRIVVFRDMTEARRREEQHRSRERLAAIGAMATAVAHEIRNPLASISGAVQMLQTTEALGETEQALMQIVVRETSQLSSWIGEFLDFARPRPLQLARCDLRELLTETVTACRCAPQVQAAGTQLVGLPEPLPNEDALTYQVVGDAALLRQALWNLLVNACQAVEEGQDRVVSVSLEPSGEGLQLAVDDSGPGIDEIDAVRVFEPFFTTKRGGTGLGLATVQRHIHAHRGHISVARSALGGARFVVWLPRRQLVEGFGDGRRPSATRIPIAEV